MRKTLGLVLGLILLAPGAWAQTASGQIYGVVTDESGAVLPGANVTISGANIGARSTTSGSQGDFRFLNLFPGTYKVNVTLTGFTTVNREVKVQTGVNVDLAFNLKVATVEETVTVTAETPIVDTKKQGTDDQHRHRRAVQGAAGARSLGGAAHRARRGPRPRQHRGQRERPAGRLRGQGQQRRRHAVVDRRRHRDRHGRDRRLARPTSTTTPSRRSSTRPGGNDVKLATGGIALNFVTKRGTNAFHGGGRYFLTHDDLQSSNLPDELESHLLPSGAPDNRLRNADGSFRDKADHIQQVADYGARPGRPDRQGQAVVLRLLRRSRTSASPA